MILTIGPILFHLRRFGFPLPINSDSWNIHTSIDGKDSEIIILLF